MFLVYYIITHFVYKNSEAQIGQKLRTSKERQVEVEAW